MLFRLAAIVAVLAIAIANWAVKLLELHRKVSYNDEGCVLLPAISPGSEDIAVIDDTMVLISAGDLDRIYLKSGKPARAGTLYAIHFKDDGEIQTRKILLEGFPEGVPFNPHGISYSNKTQRVYAVSHDCGERLVEGIEIFQLVRQDEDDTIKLVYETSIRSPSFPFGTLNDVVEGASLGELYVTQWLPYATNNKCKGHGRFVDEFRMSLAMAFAKKTKVHRCVWDAENTASAAKCNVVAEGFQVANGIVADPDKKQFFVVDASSAKNLHVLDRNQVDGSLTLKDVVALPHLADNVEYDVSSGKLTLSASPLTYQVLGRMDGDASMQVSGGMMTVEPLDNGTYVVEEVLIHDGSKLSMISSAVFVHGKILLGSPASDGALLCPIPETPLSSTTRK